MTVAIGLFASGWSAWVTGHPVVVIVPAVAGIALMIDGFLHPNPKQDATMFPKQSVAGKNAGNFAGGDISGVKIGNNYGPIALAPANTPPGPSAIKESSVCREPIVSIGTIEQCSVDHQPPDKFTHPSEGPKGSILWIMNEITGCRARSLGVSLTFRSLNGEIIGHTNRAFWINCTGYEQSLDVGARQAVFLGYCSEKAWSIYSSTRKLPLPKQPIFGDLRRLMEAPLTEPVIIPFTRTIRLDVAVVSSHLDRVIVTASYKLFPIQDSGQFYDSERL